MGNKVTTQKKVMLIRDSDFNKFNKTNTDSWDNLEFRPITREWLQKQANWFTLKGNKNIATQYRHWPYPGEWVRRTNLSKYQGNYEGWLYRWDDTGTLRVRASLGQPEGIMGILIMERYEVMLDDSQLAQPDDELTELSKV
jgi:hypothetical protein